MNTERKISSSENRAILLTLLTEFHNYCEENNLRYYLAGGTLIGAIRHKGFIPWDDDIDVFMPRYDYEIFIREYNRSKHNEVYSVVSINNTPNFYLAAAKLVDNRTELHENINTDCIIGIFIDVIPLDNMSNDRESGLKLFHKILAIRNLLNLKLIRMNKKRGLIKSLVLIVGKLFTWPISEKRLLKKIDALARTYESEKMTKYVAAATMAVYGDGEVMRSDIFAQRELKEFEHHSFYVPSGYDEFLRNLYGDYMKLPPIEKRISHHSNEAFWRV